METPNTDPMDTPEASPLSEGAEVDELLGGDEMIAENAGIPSDPADPVHVYDFRRPARLSKERKRSLEGIYGLVAKSLEGWLRGRIRDPLSVELQGVEDLTFYEFTQMLPSPCTSFIIEEGRPGGHQGIIDFGQELAFFLVDRLLGGSGRTALYERSLTPTERMLVRIFAERVTSQLTEAWRDFVDLDLSVSGFESIPEMLQVANREDRVLLCSLTVSTGDMSSPLALCLPAAALEKFFLATADRRIPVAQTDSKERLDERKSVEETLRSARIPVQARFKEITLTLRELSAMKPGTVLRTGLSTEAELFLHIAGQKRFVGAPGKLGGNLAALVGQEIEPEPDDVIQPGRGGY